MIVRTKKYQLSKKIYIQIGFSKAMREFWWAWLVPLTTLLSGIIFPIFSLMLTITIILAVLYPLFWFLIFRSIPEIPENKTIFERMEYEISTKGILMRLSVKQGMQVHWDMVKKITFQKESYIIYIARFQFIHLPISIFKKKNDINIFQAILKRKKIEIS